MQGTSVPFEALCRADNGRPSGGTRVSIMSGAKNAQLSANNEYIKSACKLSYPPDNYGFMFRYMVKRYFHPRLIF